MKRSRLLAILVTGPTVVLSLVLASPAPENQSLAPDPIILGLDGKPDDRPDAAFVESVKKHCSACHVVPLPEYMPKQKWRVRILEMVESSVLGTGLGPGDESQLWDMDIGPFVRYFESRAPNFLPLPDPWPAGSRGGLEIEVHPYNPPEASPVPVVANVRFFDLDGNGRLEIVVCDMGHGVVLHGDPFERPGELREIARVSHPDHAEMVDLDQDGRQDLLIADLGDFLPANHERGSVVWLRQTQLGVFEPHVLASKVPRTADVRAADFDGDGDLDIVVAAFGWRTVGGIFYYENQTTDWTRPRFEGRPVDGRPGGIHVPPIDLNGDGRMDFVALISQQFEHVVAFVNQKGDGGFRPNTIFRAVVPVWDSSGIQLVDMDQDGDVDLLMTNGSLDDVTLKPFHGVRWFENTGEYPWVQHDLAVMPGAHRAQAADMDGDGDLDVVACAFLPNEEHPSLHSLARQGDVLRLTSVGWLEQVSPGVFEPHPLEVGRLAHPTLDLGDYDGDGDIDIVLGNFVTFARSTTGFKAESWVELWENKTSEGSRPGISPPAR